MLCEEGDLEYDDDELAGANAVLEIIEDEKDFNEENLAALGKKHRPERVIVEYNGMWDRKNLEFPWYWDDVMEITVLDASTFKLYSDNMRPLLAEQVRRAELVVFYKADEVREKLASYARNIKAVNSGAAFIFRGAEGDIILDPDENLPYIIGDDELFLDDEGFAVMCMDSLERCEADLSFAGIICGYPKAYELENREWVEVSGIMRVRYDEEMQRDIPVCRVIAHSHFNKAIDEIDKTIDHLQKVKTELLGSDNQLRIANNKVDDISVKKLTRGNLTMKAKFDDLNKVSENE